MLDTLTEQVIAASVFLAALAAIVKVLHLHEIGRGLLIVVRDWRGDPPRKGYEGRPSFPERMAAVEHRAKQLNHDFREDIGGRLALLQEQLDVVDERTKQLQRNGGSSVADAVHRTAEQLDGVQEAVDRLEVAAQQNGDGILDLSHRVTDVNGKVDAQGARITDHRRRNDSTIAEIREYLERDREDLVTARQALEASVTELLMVDGHQEREQQHPPGQEP